MKLFMLKSNRSIATLFIALLFALTSCSLSGAEQITIDKDGNVTITPGGDTGTGGDNGNGSDTDNGNGGDTTLPASTGSLNLDFNAGTFTEVENGTTITGTFKRIDLLANENLTIEWEGQIYSHYLVYEYRWSATVSQHTFSTKNIGEYRYLYVLSANGAKKYYLGKEIGDKLSLVKDRISTSKLRPGIYTYKFDENKRIDSSLPVDFDSHRVVYDYATGTVAPTPDPEPEVPVIKNHTFADFSVPSKTTSGKSLDNASTLYIKVGSAYIYYKGKYSWEGNIAWVKKSDTHFYIDARGVDINVYLTKAPTTSVIPSDLISEIKTTSRITGHKEDYAYRP